MDNQETEKNVKELLEGYKRLPPEAQNFILSTVITAVTAQDATLREIRRVAGDLSYTMPEPGPVMGAVNG